MADPVDAILDAALAAPPDTAQAIMRLSLLDWTACALAGRDEPVARITRALALEEAGAGQASLLGGGRAPARAAALVNGATSHALDYDDTHFAHIGHPSVAVIPAAIALAEREDKDLSATLAAALAGCEASIRFGLLFGRSHYQAGFHQTATAGAFGAGLAAAHLLGFDRAQMLQVVGLVSTRASGLKSQFGTMGKPYNAGIAAANGVEAALLVARGFVSNPDALTSTNGFLSTHHTGDAPDLPDGFLMERVSHKFHACCHGLHAALEALERMKPLDANTVERVEVNTHPRWLTVCNQLAPTTGLEAKFSYRAVLALSLLGHNTAALSTYADDLVTAPKVVALRDRVTVTAIDSVTETASWVRVVTTAGAGASGHDLDAPLSLEERTRKLQAKARALLGDQTAGAVSDAIRNNDLAALVAHF